MRRFALLLLPAALFAGQARYARLGPFDGGVEVQIAAADPWTPAERNLPLPEGAWLRTGPAARVEIELDDGSAFRLGPDSQAEISDYATLSTGQRVTLLSLDHGIAYFSRQQVLPDRAILVMPGMQVIVARAARVRLEAEPQSSQVSVLDGSVRFSSPAAEIDLVQGQTSRVEPDNPTRFFLDRTIAAMDLDHWNADRDKALASPTSAGHVMEHYGLADLDSAGHWVQTDRYGAVWKPAAAQNWAPFQNGRWLWYGTLGYTWVSADPWGWLPYHYGRWARTPDLGWVWAPSVSQIFKPGEVYWLRGAKFAGWGPLAPGEQWSPAGQPQQFLNANTTYAAFQPDARAIDPTGFTDRPKEPLGVAVFTAALPSPALPAARLDATRPLVRAGSTRVEPAVKGVTFDPDSVPPPEPEPDRPAVAIENPAEPQPIVIFNAPPAPPAPPEPEPVPVAVAVPWPVLAGVIAIPPPAKASPAQSPQAAPKAAPAPTKPAPGKPVRPPPQPPAKRPKDDGETQVYSQVLKDENLPAKQLQDLDAWSRRYPESDFKADRAVLYLQAYDKTGQSARVVQLGAQLLRTQPLETPVQTLNVLYLTVKNARAAPGLDDAARRAVRNAARQLLAFTPTFFAADRRPPTLRESDWQQIRAYMESLARETLR